MGTGEILFFSGIAVMVLAALSGAAAGIVMKKKGKNLSALLTKEYGRKRH